MSTDTITSRAAYVCSLIGRAVNANALTREMGDQMVATIICAFEHDVLTLSDLAEAERIIQQALVEGTNAAAPAVFKLLALVSGIILLLVVLN